MPNVKSKLPPFFRAFKESPFDTIDALELKTGSFEWNFLKRDKKFRDVVLAFAIILAGVWFIFGFDSCQSQIEFVLVALPDYFQGKLTYDDLVFIWNDQYGKGMHYSAWVIYGFMFYGLSRYYANTLGIHGSRNSSMALAFVLLSISFFETFWHYSFAIFQNQTWVIRWEMPQLKILVQNLSFSLLGGFLIFTMYVSNKTIKFPTWLNWMYGLDRDDTVLWQPNTNFPALRLRHNWKTFVFAAIGVGSILMWGLYGDIFGPAKPLEIPVLTEDGLTTWQNNQWNFPQTVYTVENDTTDGINAGVQFHVEDDLVHAVNTGCKICVTYAFYYWGKVVVPKRKDHRYDIA